MHERWDNLKIKLRVQVLRSHCTGRAWGFCRAYVGMYGVLGCKSLRVYDGV